MRCIALDTPVSSYDYSNSILSATLAQSISHMQSIGWDTTNIWRVTPGINGGYGHFQWQSNIAPTINRISPMYDTAEEMSSFMLNESILPRTGADRVLYDNSVYHRWGHPWGYRTEHTISKTGATGIKLHFDNSYQQNSRLQIKRGSTILAERRTANNNYTFSVPWTQEFNYDSIDIDFWSSSTQAPGNAYVITTAVYRMPDALAFRPIVRFSHGDITENLTLKYTVRDNSTGVYLNSKGIEGNMYVYDTEYAHNISNSQYSAVDFQMNIYADEYPDGYYRVDIWAEKSNGLKSTPVVAYYGIDRTPPLRHSRI